MWCINSMSRRTMPNILTWICNVSVSSINCMPALIYWWVLWTVFFYQRTWHLFFLHLILLQHMINLSQDMLIFNLFSHKIYNLSYACTAFLYPSCCTWLCFFFLLLHSDASYIIHIMLSLCLIFYLSLSTAQGLGLFHMYSVSVDLVQLCTKPYE